ncbi:MAG: diphthine synthase [archaeon]
MALYLIGLGLNDQKDITLNGLELVKKADFVYLENYTSKLTCELKALEDLYNKPIILANRELVESGTELLEKAKTQNVALLIIGDVFGATTHIDIMLRAKELDIPIEIIHNASILTAVGMTGLSLYKFGKTTSVPFETENVVTPYNVLKQNDKLHTLFLLDLRPEQNKFMTFNEAIQFLLKLGKDENVFTEDTLCVGCAQLGSKYQKIVVGKAKELLNEKINLFPQCLIVPGELHFMEEDVLNTYKND